MEFNIDTAAVPQPQFNIDTGVAPPAPPSQEVAASRASKAHMGLGDVLKQDYEQLKRAIESGQESTVRENAALDITAKALEDRNQKLIKMASEKGKNLSLSDIQSLDAPAADPSTVLEKSYSRAYINTINDAALRMEDTVLDEAKSQDPEAVKRYINAGSDVMFKREYALTKAENRKADADRNAWFGFDLDTTPLRNALSSFRPSLPNDPTGPNVRRFNFGSYDVKQLLSLGFYESVVLRGNTKETSRLGFLGNVLAEQAKELMKLPAEEFKRELDRIDENLNKYDPILAQKFSAAVAGLSTGERGFYNATEMINVATAASILAPGREAAKAVGQRQVRNLGELSAGADGIYRPTGGPPTAPAGGGAAAAVPQIGSDDLGRGAMSAQEVLRTSPTPTTSKAVQQAAKAVEDVLKSSASPVVTKSSIAAGAGDLREAGVQRAVTSATERNPQRDATDTLLSLHRGQTEAIRNDPGLLPREQHTRLLTASESFDKNMIDLVVNSSKVQRTPVAVEQGFRDISDKVKHYFPGRENTILDVNVIYDDVSNTYHHKVKIGNYDGTLFSSFEQAARHAAINGYTNADLGGKGSDTVYIPEKIIFKTEYPTKDKAVKTPRGFEIQQLPDGAFRIVGEDGVEVVPSASPVEGHVPYNLKTKKFGDPVGPVTIEQQGLGFYILVNKPLNETETFVRDGLIGDDRAKSVSNKETGTLSSVSNAVLGLIRNPYDTLSRVENENRAKVVFGQSKFIDAIRNEIAVVEDLYKGLVGDTPWIVDKPLSYTRTVTGANKQIAADFTRALVAAQTAEDPRTGLPGYYMQTPAEIQHFWQANFGRPPSFKEQAAYLAVGRADHADHILRNIQQYMFKSRAGVEQWQFTINKDGKKIPSGFFDARQVKSVNSSSDEVTLIVDASGAEKYFHQMGTKTQQEFRDQLQEGRWLGVELWNPEARPLKRTDVEGNPMRIRYVFSNAFERKPLTYDQVGYRGGGHWEYDYDNAVKQPIIRPQRVGGKFQNIYEGDTTFGFVSSRAQGEEFAKKMNELSALIRSKDMRAAKAFTQANFDIPWKDMRNSFRASKNPQTGEITPPRFSTDPRQAFRVVPKGKTILDLDKDMEAAYTKKHPKTDVDISTFVDGTRHGSLARNFQTEFIQPRDSYKMYEFANTGSAQAPFYQFRPAKLTDPITTMTRAMTRIVNSTYMNDYKISAVEHWLEENADLLQATQNEIRSAPFYFFNEGKFKTGADHLRVLNARTNRYKIQQFIGTPSVVDSTIHAVKQELADSRAMAKSKTGKIAKSTLIVPEWLLDKIHSPVDFGRGMTYHLNLGLFAINQVVVQSMAFTTIFGIAGLKNATAGSFASMMHQWSRINGKPEIIDWMDRTAVTFGWRLGEFKEAMKLLEKTGFGTIRNELSLDTDNFRKQIFFRGDAKGLLDAGQIPFHEGNLNVRFGAWYTAFREFRDKNPFLRIGPIEEGKILHRANILNVTMTRDANTILNKGLVGVPFQFYDYMKKMADTFWGKNTAGTPAQRAYVRGRMFLMYALLGGVAGATGVSGIPINDMIRKRALEGTLPAQTEAYVPGNNLASTLLMEGPVSTIVAYITGYGDPQKGTFYNFNNRFNPNGLQILRDVIQTDPSFWKILTGAMGSTVANEIASLSGFTNAMYSMIEGDPAKEAWPLKIDDWKAPLENIKSWRDSERLAYAIAYGKWRDRHGATQQDIGITDAIFRTVTGLTDQNVDDMFLKTLTVKDRQALYNKAFKEFEEESRKAEQAAANGDRQQADDYNKRAFFALTSRNVPTELWDKALHRRATMNRDTIDKNNEGYYLKYVPTNLQQKAIEAYRKIQQKKQ